MANEEHLRLLEEGITSWNEWRVRANPFMPNLRRANLQGLDLTAANFRDVYLRRANLRGAVLRSADLREANLSGADLERADLTAANLAGANLRAANLGGARLIEANLMSAILVETDLRNSTLDGARVYGTTTWAVRLDGASQANLVVTRPNEPVLTVDDLELAQFIYLMLNNRKIRSAIDTITSKVVLILGRFKPERKAVLHAIHQALRARNYVPVMFDFDKPTALDLTETITLLARMARFIVADLTEPSSIPQELQAIAPNVAVPVVPLLQGDRPYAMFADYRKYHWVLGIQRYRDELDLLGSLDALVIVPAEAKSRELVASKC